MKEERKSQNRTLTIGFSKKRETICIGKELDNEVSLDSSPDSKGSSSSMPFPAVTATNQSGIVSDVCRHLGRPWLERKDLDQGILDFAAAFLGPKISLGFPVPMSKTTRILFQFKLQIGIPTQVGRISQGTLPDQVLKSLKVF